MPPKKGAPAPARGSKLTLSVGLVNVQVKMAPLVRSTAVGGRRLCPCHNEPVKAQSVCAESGEVVEAVTGFEHEGRFVTGVDRAEHKSERDGMVDLTATVELDTFDPLYFDKSYLLWPNEGGAAGYDLIAASLKASGKALIGTTVLTSATRVLAIRWSPATETLVAHTIAYDQAIAWNDAKLVATANAERGEVDDGQLALADQLLGSLADSIDLEAIEDDYANSLQAAIAAAAAGLPAPAPKAEAPRAQVVDLMDALKASVAEAQGKKPAAKKPRAKKAAA
jgi:DNA end-binding protein Ku